MGARLSTCCRYYGLETRRETKYLRLTAPAPPYCLGKKLKLRYEYCTTNLCLFDMDTSSLVTDYDAVRRVLMYVPGWEERPPQGEFQEFWFYVANDREKRWPAAKARVPWPSLQDAPTHSLQALVHVVNQVANRRILKLM